MSEKSSSVGMSITTFIGFLTLLFIALRLTGFIDWSWWWVLSPIWICLAFGVFNLIIAFVILFAFKDS